MALVITQGSRRFSCITAYGPREKGTYTGYSLEIAENISRDFVQGFGQSSGRSVACAFIGSFFLFSYYLFCIIYVSLCVYPDYGDYYLYFFR